MLLFSLGVVVLLELSVACNIHIRESEKGQVRFRCQQHTCFNSFFRRTVGQVRKFFFSLNPFVPQGESSIKISAL